MRLHHLAVPPMDNNCYLLVNNNEALLIDAANNANEILTLLDQLQASLTAVITTHHHADHVQALPEILASTQAHHYASAGDAPFLPAPVDQVLHHGDQILLGDTPLDILILRGHTPEGVAVAGTVDGVTNIFTGDSLFPGGVGKTENSADFQQLFSDVTSRIFAKYPDTTIIWPGHGRHTTLGEQRPYLQSWQERGW
ncbi:MBL fold metallo-hydrolase [Corynebacterium sp. HS2168-gen11]|uniref:MBL fold metallo-hydrolase n=1 Tax=Corynebacterium sp. HS2168-gen11 TaxID=2974027 RepID=UPI00216B36E5|nr:MBL fold metallo-hydrolase [Corynebacterium sp. HS2168-gen11]MCS4534776.1 MBL fold metallo-hydrolase [Corynebacterium sp. HS2168-gen11]